MLHIISLFLIILLVKENGKKYNAHNRRGIRRRLRHQIPYEYNVEPAALTLDSDPFRKTTTETAVRERTCKQGYVAIGKRCFHFSDEKMTWNQAVQRCRETGGTLAGLENYEEIWMLKKYFGYTQAGESIVK